jgi:hypothetical protein
MKNNNLNYEQKNLSLNFESNKSNNPISLIFYSHYYEDNWKSFMCSSLFVYFYH